MRRVASLPRLAYLFVALILIAACLMISLLPRSTGRSIQSAKSVLQSIPLYPGATMLYRDDTDTPGGQINHYHTLCSIECARIIYETPQQPASLIHFYEGWASSQGWQHWGTSYLSVGRSYYQGLKEFKGWRFLGQPFPWVRAEYEMRQDHVVDMMTQNTSRGTTRVEFIVHRLAPMPSDTPIPTMPPPPPTKPIPVMPGSVRTQQPNLPASVPTVP